MKNIETIKKSWNEFTIAFWIIFVMKLFLQSSAELTGFTVVPFLQIIPILMMVYAMGFYSYKISGRKLFWLNGLLGLFWFLTIGIFIGFFAVKRIKDYQLKKVDSAVPSSI